MARVLEYFGEDDSMRGPFMRSIWKNITVGAIFAYFAACAPVKFSGDTQALCGSNGTPCVQKCVGSACINSYSAEKVISSPMVDILVVDDNSGSMSQHQNKFATAWSGFIGQLDTAQLDYRLAITTTDISNKYSTSGMNATNGPNAVNQQGALQDGNLISFAPNTSYLSNTTPNRDSLFISTIKRNETVQCENSGYAEASCPSSDERAIYALNLSTDYTMEKFVRPTSHLAVIILSNEDERGLSDQASVRDANDQALLGLFPLEANDLPGTFTTKFKSKYPSKSLAVHSIIVKPGDAACLASETHLGPNPIVAKAGYSYDKLSQLTGGLRLSICDANYTTNLKAISDAIQAEAISLKFQCRPIGDQYTVTYTPQPAVAPVATPDWTKLELKFNQMPPGTKVKLTYDCSVN